MLVQKRISPGRKLGLAHDTVPHLARPEYLREPPRSRSQQATQADQDGNYFLAEERKKSHHGLPRAPEQLWRGVGEEFGVERGQSWDVTLVFRWRPVSLNIVFRFGSRNVNVHSIKPTAILNLCLHVYTMLVGQTFLLSLSKG